ncbi:uncharacterized protein LOC129720154 [Wyeomyia smithii]|uniref:uncharacterized protein LOC129720154 n=1 Tax=Wyeomyia smithii TaxID=174621 RepID=UPI002467EB07|nr:uncharacterized protein LOC129720154 [Wyeomyia smithii]
MRMLVYLHLLQDNRTIFSAFSELAKLTRFVAYCFRFRHNCKLPKNQRVLSPLSPQVVNCVLKSLVRLAQRQEFPTEVQLHSRKQTENTTLHGGPSLVLSTIRQRFWPLRGRELARKVFRRCVTCFWCNPTTGNQIMSPYPSFRLRPARAFTYSGMDYCGPFLIRPLIGKGSSVKLYVALHVCMVVKAVHLEVVADLSSAACINAVKRFVAKRGRVLQLHCDNASAFVGADRELRQLRKEYLRQFQSAEWGLYCADNGITFRFIPARSPHFGGIREAGVKSFKYHFRRVMGQKAFTMDQFLTVVAQDMQRSVQDLWRCWSRDYVSQFHQRSKWRHSAVDVRKGQLVLLKLDNYPPLQWPLGRIIETIPGSDGRVRVVVVRTASKDFKRAVTEITVLPIDSDDEPNSHNNHQSLQTAQTTHLDISMGIESSQPTKQVGDQDVTIIETQEVHSGILEDHQAIKAARAAAAISQV